jgi:class 3 adenylate cyclase
VEIALARRDVETTRHAAEELEGIVADLDRPLFVASVLTAKGAVLLRDGNASAAGEMLARAWRLWLETGLPFESAKARTLYAEALAAQGDDGAARKDLRAARSVFERLGASLEVGRVDRLLADLESPAGGPAQRAAKTFMFTDIVTSTDLVTLIGDDAWEDLLRWHDRELKRAFEDHRGELVDHTGDGFFVAFDRAADAIDCAVDIQRRLARHRRDHGFAPWVRIGLHAAEATRRGTTYSGKGVHVAARIGAAAAREEILISDTVVEQAGNVDIQVSAPRSLSLKGVPEPVAVRSVDWRGDPVGSRHAPAAPVGTHVAVPRATRPGPVEGRAHAAAEEGPHPASPGVAARAP